MSNSFQWKTVRADGYGGFAVHGFREATSGCMKGQTMKVYLNAYDSVDEAVAAHPELKSADGEIRYGSKWTDPQPSYAHLSGDDGSYDHDD